MILSDNKLKVQMIDVMERFDEPQLYKPNRYDNRLENTSALTEAKKAFESKNPHMEKQEKEEAGFWHFVYTLENIFRVAEEQYGILSSSESIDFQDEINTILIHQGNWEMINGIIASAEPKEENRITEVTRQEIIDLVNIGFRDSGTFEDVRIFWSGRLEETDFLSRLYDLSKMKSTDSRFSDAAGDIWQHRVNNDDWVFYDSRFAIKNGSDRTFLGFICEMFHPAVRDEKKNWKRLLELINDLLHVDGYELHEKAHISGRTVYDWRSMDNKNVVIQNQVENLIQSFNSDYIRTQIKAMNSAIDTHPYDAIGKAKELLETCCKTILNNKGVSIDTDWDIIRLTKETCGVLKLTPDDIDNAAKASETIKKLLGNLSVISQSMAELRNSYGSGHGKDAKFKGLSPRHARLAVGAGVTAVHFLWETYEEKQNMVGAH